MLYKELKIGDKELKLRLSTRDCVALEKKLGRNPLDDLMAVEQGKLPTVVVLHASLQKYQSNYSLENVYDLYDEYIEEGNTLTDMLSVITDVFKVSGFFKEPDNETPEN